MDNLYGPEATVRRNFRGAKILFIDDNPDHCALVRTVLQACMPEVTLLVAPTVEEALNQLSQCLAAPTSLPRLVLLDLYLPQIQDGWRLLQVLKAGDSPYRLVPVTVLSHSDKPSDVKTSYELGAASYLVKPTDYPQWLAYFGSLRDYWWHTVTLPTS